MYLKKSHDEEEDFIMADFLVNAAKVSMRNREYFATVPGKAQQGVAASRKKRIVDKLTGNGFGRISHRLIRFVCI